MIQLDRRHLLTGLGAMSVAACSDPFEIGTGKKPPKGGIGGTGIVGTLTDFGSLLVNGLRIETDGSAEITDAFGTMAGDAMSVGHHLTIEAATVDGVLVARRVRIVHPVIGRVDRADPSGMRGVVAGVPIQLEPGAEGVLTPGARVAVSGAWRDTTVIASRIDERPGDGPVVISGVIRRAGTSAPPTLAGVRIRTSVALPESGTFVTAIGRHAATGFVAEQIIPGRFTGAAGPLTALSIDGYLEVAATAPFFAVSGLGHSFDEDAKLAAFRDQRSIFSGTYDGKFVVRDTLRLPEALPERRRLLAGIVDGTVTPEAIPAR